MFYCVFCVCLHLDSPSIVDWVRVGHLFSLMSCIFSFVCLRPVSCMPNVASLSGLSILYCPFGFP